MALPAAWLAVSLSGNLGRVWRLSVPAAAVIPELLLHPLALGWYGYTVWKNVTEESPAERDSRVAAFVSRNVGDADRAGGIYMACGPGDIGVLECLGTKPVGRYMSQPDLTMRLDEKIAVDVRESFAAARPQWILTMWPLENYRGLMPEREMATFECVDSLDIRPGGYGFRLYRRAPEAR